MVKMDGTMIQILRNFNLKDSIPQRHAHLDYLLCDALSSLSQTLQAL